MMGHNQEEMLPADWFAATVAHLLPWAHQRYAAGHTRGIQLCLLDTKTIVPLSK